ncbi:QRFP-like peptide receptor [Rhopilema esculentum]|uniref:QRFP-like peptide receptor n=1 Tax=Rhopilema esculentum TaxID=499914 RepID=UPI0031E1933D
MNSSNVNDTVTATVVCHGFNKIGYFFASKAVISMASISILSSFSFCIIAMVGNTLTLYSIWKASLYSNPSYTIIAGLAITDFLSSITVLPLNTVIRFQDIFNIHSCVLKHIFATVATILVGWSTIMMCTINIDRFIALYFPLRLKAWNLSTWYSVLIASSWSLFLLYALLGASNILSLKIFFSLQMSMVIFALVFISVIQVLVYRLIKARQRRLAVLAPRQSTAQMIDAIEQRKQRKCNRTLFIVTVAFFICYLPRFAVLVALRPVKSSSFTLIYIGSRWSEIVLFSNSALNPIIYAIRLPKIRRHVFEFLRRVFPWFEKQHTLDTTR